ncbi:MAG: LysM peptidoglycan-binding domain-containing protein, partial [Gemmatimonadales bacterium]
MKQGDTLWGLAQQYFGDPLLWPEIYRLNTDVVEDPHWIYPGEVLRLHAEGAVASVPADTASQAVAAVTPPAAPPASADSTTPVPSTVPVAAPADSTPAAQPAVETATPVADTAAPAPVAVADDTTPIFPPTSGLKQPDILRTTYEDNYRPLRRSDFYSSGFLSENQALPYGRVLGNVTPLQIRSTEYGDASMIYSRIAITPPKGGSYQVGDTLLLVQVDRSEDKWGDVVVPVGLAKVVDVSRAQNQAVVTAQYGKIHEGTLTLLAERFVDPGHVHPAPVANGVQGHLL